MTFFVYVCLPDGALYFFFFFGFRALMNNSSEKEIEDCKSDITTADEKYKSSKWYHPRINTVKKSLLGYREKTLKTIHRSDTQSSKCKEKKKKEARSWRNPATSRATSIIVIRYKYVTCCCCCHGFHGFQAFFCQGSCQPELCHGSCHAFLIITIISSFSFFFSLFLSLFFFSLTSIRLPSVVDTTEDGDYDTKKATTSIFLMFFFSSTNFMQRWKCKKFKKLNNKN